MDTWIDYKLQFAWENFTSIYNIYIIVYSSIYWRFRRNFGDWHDYR